MINQTIESWLAGESITGARFCLNEVVIISSRQHTGIMGSVISLITLKPEPLYTVETSSGQDVEVLERDMQSIESR